MELLDTVTLVTPTYNEKNGVPSENVLKTPKIFSREDQNSRNSFLNQ